MDRSLRKKKIILAFLEGFLIIIIVLLAGLIFLLSYQRNYTNKVYPGVSFLDINLSGKTRSQTAELIENYAVKANQKKIIILTDAKEIPVVLADTGITLDTKNITDSAYQVGRDDNFLLELYKSAKSIFAKKQLSIEITTNQPQFDGLLTKVTDQLNQKAVDAQITIVNGVATISPPQQGQVIDTADLISKIRNSFEKQNFGTIAPKTSFSEPQIIESDLTNAKNEAEGLLKKKAVLSGADQSFNLGASEIGNLVSFPVNNETVTATVDENKVFGYVGNTLAKKIDIAKIDRKLSATNQSVISEGVNGRHLDRNDAKKQLLSFLNSAQPATQITLLVVTDVFGDQMVFPDEGVVPGRFPGKYLDVDLTHQQMYLFDGVNLIAQYTVSTGKWSTPTPVGTRSILDKSPRAFSAKYNLYMPWWNSLGGGYGIHELPEWSNGTKEGESHLGTPVSHGCIRLGVGPAQTVYNWADVGTPVYIHK